MRVIDAVYRAAGLAGPGAVESRGLTIACQDPPMDLRRLTLYVSRTRVGFGLVMMASPRLAFGPIYGSGRGRPAPRRRSAG